MLPPGLGWSLIFRPHSNWPGLSTSPFGFCIEFLCSFIKKTQKSFIKKPQMVGGRARCGRTAKGCEVSFWG